MINCFKQFTRAEKICIFICAHTTWPKKRSLGEHTNECSYDGGFYLRVKSVRSCLVLSEPKKNQKITQLDHMQKKITYLHRLMNVQRMEAFT